MQALDAITIKHLAGELNEQLAGAKISKIQHPHADEFLITVWGGNKAARENHNLLYINLNPQFSFCTLINTAQKNAGVMTTLHKATSICMLLRKHLSNAKILSVSAQENERVIDFHFENFNELGNRVILVLSLELMGKHSNMIFYDDIQQVILGVAHSVSEQMSQHRELTAGLPYAPPPKPAGKVPLASLTQQAFASKLSVVSKDQWPDVLNQWLAGWGKLILSDAIALTDSTESLYQLLNQLEKGEALKPSLSKDGKRFSLVPPDDHWQAYNCVSETTRRYYMNQLVEKRLGSFRQRLSSSVAAQQKKLAKQLDELEPVSEKDIADLQTCGDLILTAHTSGLLPSKPPGGIVEIPIVGTEKTRPLEIDPHSNWPQNAELYYRRAKKARAKENASEKLREQLARQKQYYEELQSLIARADSLGDLATLEEELISAGLAKPNVKMSGSGKREKQKMAGITTFNTSTGLTLYVGKTGQGNAQIVSKIAKPDDWWFHVQEMPGSHVLLKNDSKNTPDNQTLLEAANLAVYYSSARDSKNVPVVYTQAKHVRKIPDSWPGHVTYKQEQGVFITVDPALVESLLNPDISQDDADGDSV